MLDQYLISCQGENTVTLTSMISGYARNGLGEESVSLHLWTKKLHISAKHSMFELLFLTACGCIGCLNPEEEINGKSSRIWFRKTITSIAPLFCFVGCSQPRIFQRRILLQLLVLCQVDLQVVTCRISLRGCDDIHWILNVKVSAEIGCEGGCRN